MKKSGTDWERLESMTDKETDFSEIPELDEEFFRNVEIRLPRRKQHVSMRLDAHDSPGTYPVCRGIMGKSPPMGARVHADSPMRGYPGWDRSPSRRMEANCDGAVRLSPAERPCSLVASLAVCPFAS